MFTGICSWWFTTTLKFGIDNGSRGRYTVITVGCLQPQQDFYPFECTVNVMFAHHLKGINYQHCLGDLSLFQLSSSVWVWFCGLLLWVRPPLSASNSCSRVQKTTHTQFEFRRRQRQQWQFVRNEFWISIRPLLVDIHLVVAEWKVC